MEKENLYAGIKILSSFLAVCALALVLHYTVPEEVIDKLRTNDLIENVQLAEIDQIAEQAAAVAVEEASSDEPLLSKVLSAVHGMKKVSGSEISEESESEAEETETEAVQEEYETKYYKFTVTMDNEPLLNVRETPSKEGEKVGSIANGSEGFVIGSAGDWTLVHTRKFDGFVLTRYITLSEVTEEEFLSY